MSPLLFLFFTFFLLLLLNWIENWVESISIRINSPLVLSATTQRFLTNLAAIQSSWSALDVEVGLLTRLKCGKSPDFVRKPRTIHNDVAYRILTYLNLWMGNVPNWNPGQWPHLNERTDLEDESTKKLSFVCEADKPRIGKALVIWSTGIAHVKQQRKCWIPVGKIHFRDEDFRRKLVRKWLR